MSEIQLSGSQDFLTQKSSFSYRVKSGVALVYISPIRDGHAGRRTLVSEMLADDIIPAVNFVDNQGENWVFVISSLGSCILDEIEERSDKIINNFIDKLKICKNDEDTFEDSLLDYVNRKIDFEESDLNLASIEQKSDYNKSFSVIYNLFDQRSPETSSPENTSADENNYVYNAVAYLCEKMSIDILPLSSITKACGKNPKIDDIARVSNFSCREVSLDKKWYKKDISPMIVFASQSNKPLVCYPKNAKKCILYNCETNKSLVVNKSAAMRLIENAYVIVPPLEDRSYSIKDILDFGKSTITTASYVTAVILFTVLTAVSLLLPVFANRIFDNFIPYNDLTSLMQMGAVIGMLLIIMTAVFIVKSISIDRISKKMEINIFNALIDRIFKLPMSFYSDSKNSYLAGSCVNFSASFSKAYASYFNGNLTAIFSIPFLISMFCYSLKLGVAGLLLAALNCGFVWLISRKIKDKSTELAESYSDLSSSTDSVIKNISKIRISEAENKSLLGFLESFAKIKKSHKKLEKFSAYISLINLVFVTVSAVVLCGAMFLNYDSVTIGRFAGFLISFAFLSFSVNSWISSKIKFANETHRFETIKPIFETPRESSKSIAMPEQLKGNIDVYNLTFKYENSIKDVLSDLSFSIKEGEFVGIIGLSGAGKSTLMNLLLGLYDANIGQIYYDSIDFDSMNKTHVRSQIGTSLQDGKIINGTIYDNILLGNEGTDMNTVDEIVSAVDLDFYIKGLPNGIFTVIDDSSGMVSGGTKQRILLARALVRNPNLIILDEPTTATSMASQSKLYEYLSSLSGTKVIFSNKADCFELCDKIMVLSDGKISETGTFNELIDKKGKFFEFVNLK